MGKVKDGSPASSVPAPAPKSAGKPAKGGASGDSKRRFASFATNLARVNLYKPLQGRQARLWTAIGLGTTILMGLREVYLSLQGTSTALTAWGVPALIGAVLYWVMFRMLQYPPFVEFLIATEAEMNKVSWTSRDDLKRATTVVLVTVALMAVFLFGVDWVWSNLLKLIGVLKIGDTSALGSSA
jgi:preprotein translocase subunit SecE